MRAIPDKYKWRLVTFYSLKCYKYCWAQQRRVYASVYLQAAVWGCQQKWPALCARQHQSQQPGASFPLPYSPTEKEASEFNLTPEPDNQSNAFLTHRGINAHTWLHRYWANRASPCSWSPSKGRILKKRSTWGRSLVATASSSRLVTRAFRLRSASWSNARLASTALPAQNRRIILKYSMLVLK